MKDEMNNERNGLPGQPHMDDLLAPLTEAKDRLLNPEEETTPVGAPAPEPEEGADGFTEHEEPIEEPTETPTETPDGTEPVPEPTEETRAEDTATDAEAQNGEAAEDTPMPGELDIHGKRIIKPYHERAYLLYGESEVKPSLDLGGTMTFLRDIGFDGGELRQARKGRYYSETNKNTGGTDALYCSYCGREISGVDYYRLPDGRLRCTNCSRTLVRTQEELREIYNRVIVNLEVFFGATIKVPVGIELLEERKLKKKLKRPISDIDNKSMLILGVAVNRKKEYEIYLENGAPRISVIATFVHELTHIWQYTHWSEGKAFPKLTPPMRLLIYEGMAKWVEIQYLYLIGEQAVAKREEAITRARMDEYGIGFNLYEDKYPLSREAMLCNETPFKTDGYPVS